MHCLWLTLADPEPAVNGQFIYSAGLINAIAAAGADLSIVGLARTGAPQRFNSSAIEWRLFNEQQRSKLIKVLSPLPLVSLITVTPAIEQTIDTCLAAGEIDTVVFDSIAVGWALPILLRQKRQKQLKIVYLSHNHETTVARQIASSSAGIKGAGLALDALKVAKLERRLVTKADLVTANDPADCERFNEMAPRRPVIFLPPGYSGPTVPSRQLDGSLPRRAVVVGSFNFPPKRHSLEAFLSCAAPLLAAAKIELQIVGGAEASYLDSLRRRFPTIEFTGFVEDVKPFMANARVALVPDLLGGFKLKAFDYVFNRIPILAMDIAVPGMPLEDGRSIRLFSSHQALAEGLVNIIDDVSVLDAQQNMAFDACVNCSAWDSIGERLFNSIRGIPAA
jgi:hypothetical protein